MLDEQVVAGLVIAALSGAGALFGRSLLIWLRGRSSERLTGLKLESERERRTLDAEKESFLYLQQALADARQDIKDLETARRAAETSCREALADSANVRQLANTQQLGAARRVQLLEHAVADLEARLQEARFIAEQLRAIVGEYRRDLMAAGLLQNLTPVPPLPWARERRRLTEGEGEDGG